MNSTPKTVKKYLSDIWQAIELIQSFTAEIETEDSYNANLLVQSAVERQLAIIGEALNQALKLQPDIPITDAQKIVRYRNFLVHAYDMVYPPYVWAIVRLRLPVLAQEVKTLLES